MSLLASSRRGRPGKVVFVSYGAFDCNSGGHIAAFAGELVWRGLSVAVCARDRVLHAYAFGPPAFEVFANQDLEQHPEAVVGFDGALEPGRTLLVAWTPRKAARRPVLAASRRLAIPYVIHFEDNEDHLAELRLAADLGEAAAEAAARDAEERRSFVEGAAGATVITPRLEEALPAALPRLVLEPGVDHALFGAPLPPLRRASLLRMAGAPEGAAVIVYPGNIHRANVGEMAELYRALAALRAKGRKLVLLKTGKDDVPMTEHLGFDPAEAGVVSLGTVDRALLADLVKCADLFVQPGAPGPFNDYRLPSKLPEFLAVGRPVLLPATNIGLRLRDREDAVLLREGSAAEIAAGIEAVLDDAALAARLAANSRAFARRELRWDRQADKLVDFLGRLG